MKLEIELDLNKIDYDSINKQIAEKIAALNIEEMYDVESKVVSRITRTINDLVDNSYNNYIDRYWSAPTTDGKKLIETMSKSEIERRTGKVIEEVFTNEFNDDALRELVIKLLPSIFCNLLFTRLESSIFTNEYDYRERLMNQVTSEINYVVNSKLDHMRY